MYEKVYFDLTFIEGGAVLVLMALSPLAHALFVVAVAAQWVGAFI